MKKICQSIITANSPVLWSQCPSMHPERQCSVPSPSQHSCRQYNNRTHDATQHSTAQQNQAVGTKCSTAGVPRRWLYACCHSKSTAKDLTVNLLGAVACKSVAFADTSREGGVPHHAEQESQCKQELLCTLCTPYPLPECCCKGCSQVQLIEGSHHDQGSTHKHVAGCDNTQGTKDAQGQVTSGLLHLCWNTHTQREGGGEWGNNLYKLYEIFGKG